MIEGTDELRRLTSATRRGRGSKHHAPPAVYWNMNDRTTVIFADAAIVVDPDVGRSSRDREGHIGS